MYEKIYTIIKGLLNLKTINSIALFISINALNACASSAVNSPILLGMPVAAPMGLQEFCFRNLGECGFGEALQDNFAPDLARSDGRGTPRRASHDGVSLSGRATAPSHQPGAALNLARAINTFVNQAITYRSDLEVWGVEDYWTLPLSKHGMILLIVKTMRWKSAPCCSRPACRRAMCALPLDGCSQRASTLYWYSMWMAQITCSTAPTVKFALSWIRPINGWQSSPERASCPGHRPRRTPAMDRISAMPEAPLTRIRSAIELGWLVWFHGVPGSEIHSVTSGRGR